MNICLVAGSTDTLKALKLQLSKYLDDKFHMKYYVVDLGIDGLIQGDLIIFSSQYAYDELIEMNKIDTNCEIVIAERTIDFDGLDDIVALAVGTEVLLVNDMKETTHQVIENLKDIGITGLDFIPYYPGCEPPMNRPKIAITPGEASRVPSWIDKIIDIGPRIMGLPTILDILNKTGLAKSLSNQFSKAYLKKIIKMNQIVSASRNEIAHLNEKLSDMLNRLGDGLLLFDGDGRILVANERVKKLLNMEQSQVVGRQIGDVLTNGEIIKTLMEQKHQEKIVDSPQGPLAVSVIVQRQGQLLATFKSVEDSLIEHDRLKREFVRKGFYAKYAFEDIVGKSKRLEKSKAIAKKLARSNLTILIQGESGTGKELFASAIHNASSRSSAPFLAVNFSALPDNLLESELFGYEEGAFTGAKKGGRAGLFEQAHGGTIFLDEVGDISPKMQARLLRVLQEGEIMRVGGTEIRTVDTRVVAATNKNLFEMVKSGDFREDLYYRLKTGTLTLPALRERREDIEALCDHFLALSGIPDLQLSQAALSHLKSQGWHGNIRELENVIAYMIAVRSTHVLDVDDLPEENESHKAERNSIKESEETFLMTNTQRFLLETIDYYETIGEIVGRKQLAELSQRNGHDLSENQVRTKLKHLEVKGLIFKGKGKVGTRLTEYGHKILRDYAPNHKGINH